MQLNVRTLNLDASQTLDQYANERMKALLGFVADRVESIDIRLEDDHGSRHGRQLRCNVRVHIAGAGTVMVDQVDTDIYRAIDEAGRRVKRAVRRRVKRSQVFDHRRASRAAA